MISFERGLNLILEVAKAAANREFQQEAWLSGRPSTSSPTEIYNTIFYDYAFDFFYEAYSKNFTQKQLVAWHEFKQQLEKFGEKYDIFPNEQVVFDDPDWHLVREAAGRFVTAFES
jgi:8-oxo-dGTP pyrophosphatase MutT (NUDIX family)